MVDINQQLQKASQLQNKGQFKDALKIYTRILKSAPKFVPALNMTGITYAQLGKYPKAIEYFKKIIQLEPRNLAAYENLAKSQIQLNQFELAESNYQHALKISPVSFPALFGLGGALMSQNKLEQSLDAFTRALKINPRDPLVHLNMGILLNKLDRLEDAVKSFKEALKYDPQSKPAHAKLGQIYLHAGNSILAEQHLKKATSMGLTDTEVELDLAESLEKNNKVDEAYQHYRKAVEIEPLSQNAYTRFDQYQLKSGSKEKLKFLEELASDYLYKDWEEAVNNAKKLLGMLSYHEQRALDEAADFLNEYKPGDLNNREWWQDQIDRFGDPILGHDKVMRSIHSAVFSWSLPDSETLARIAEFVGDTHLYSLGSGSGFWEKLLIDHFNLDVTATEYQLRHRFMPMSFADYSVVKINDADTIFLSWIIRGDNSISNILEQIRPGQKLILIGEPPDKFGIPRICATPEIFAYLEREFILEETIQLVSYCLLNDTVSLYIRK